MHRRIAIATGSIVTALAIAVAILFTMDFGRFENELEAYLSEFTGREFAIEGDFHASLGPSVDIRIDGARLGNAAWSATPHMLEVDEFELRFSLLSMFGKTLRVEYLKIAGVQVLVEAHDGVVNWDFGAETGISEWLSSRSVTQYTVAYAEITDLGLRYGGGWLDALHTLEVASCVIDQNDDDFQTIDLDGRVGDSAVALRGLTGPRRNLARGEHVDLDLTLEVGDFRLATLGHLERLNPVQRPELNIEFAGPDVADLLAELGLPEFTSGPVDLRGNLDQQHPGVALDVAGTMGEVRLGIQGTLQDLERLEGLALGFSATGPHLGELFKILDMNYLPAGTFTLRGRLDGDEPPFELHDVAITVGDVSAEMRGTIATDSVEIDVSGSGPDFVSFMRTWTERSLPAGPFAASGSANRGFADDTWTIRDLSVVLEDGLEFSLDGEVEPTPEFLRVDADIALAGQELADVLALWFENLSPLGSFKAAAHVVKGQKTTRFDQIEATLGDEPPTAADPDHIAGELVYESGDTPRITAVLRSDGLDLTRYSDSLFDVVADARPAESDAWFPDIPLSLDRLDLADLDVQLEARTLALEDAELSDVDMRLQVENGTLSIDPLNATWGGGIITGRLNADNTQAAPSVAVELELKDVTVEDPLDDAGNPVQRPLMHAEIRLTANGQTTRGLLATANGSIRVDEDAGLMELDPLKRVLDAINPPPADEKYINLECYVLHADINDGIASARAVAIQTDRLKIAARGNVNLGTEALDLQFKVAPRTDTGLSVISIASPHVAITGTIQNPRITFGTGATVAALITDAWSMVFDAFNDIASQDTNVCEEAQRRTESPRQRR